jgi:pyridoxal phosphate enzyme (YggS family)
MIEWRGFFSRHRGVCMSSIGDNVARVRERMEAACHRAGRRREDVTLVAISKTFSADLIREAYKAGLRDFGENRVQEATAKRPALSDLTVTWHLVGHLQTNKAKRARELFHWVHSIDSERIAQKLDQSAVCTDERLQVLLEVNLGEEPGKFGAGEEQVLRLAEQVGRFETLELRGLMIIPPYFEETERARPFFRQVRELGRTIAAAKLHNVSMEHLSMGMTHDFEIAIEEGATIVRVGTGIFGARQ